MIPGAPAAGRLSSLNCSAPVVAVITVVLVLDHYLGAAGAHRLVLAVSGEVGAQALRRIEPVE